MKLNNYWMLTSLFLIVIFLISLIINQNRITELTSQLDNKQNQILKLNNEIQELKDKIDELKLAKDEAEMITVDNAKYLKDYEITYLNNALNSSLNKIEELYEEVTGEKTLVFYDRGGKLFFVNVSRPLDENEVCLIAKTYARYRRSSLEFECQKIDKNNSLWVITYEGLGEWDYYWVDFNEASRRIIFGQIA